MLLRDVRDCGRLGCYAVSRTDGGYAATRCPGISLVGEYPKPYSRTTPPPPPSPSLLLQPVQTLPYQPMPLLPDVRSSGSPSNIVGAARSV
eukprot:3933210-Rhodomonas_salina.4